MIIDATVVTSIYIIVDIWIFGHKIINYNKAYQVC